MTVQTRKIESELITRAATFTASTLNKDNRTVDVVFSTGAEGRRSTWSNGDYMEALEISKKAVRLERFNSKSAPVLDNHNSYSGIKGMLGVVVSARIENGQGVATVLFDSGEAGMDAMRRVEEGTLTKVSVGYRVYTYKKEERKDMLPLYTAIDWEPMELSFVAMPFDTGASVRNDSNTKFNIDIMEENEINGVPVEQVTPTGNGQENRSATATQSPGNNGGANTGGQEQVDPVISYAVRNQQITTAVRTANLPDAFALELINGGVNIDQARAQILARMATATPPVSGANPASATGADASTSGDVETENFRAGVAAGLALRSSIIPATAMTERERTLGNQYRNLSLTDVARESLERQGVNTRGMDRVTLATRALGASTSDFPILLEGAARNVLLNSYNLVPDVWSTFCVTGSVDDFREYKRTRMGSISRLNKMNESGEFKYLEIKDGEQEKISIDSFGNMIGITRKMIVNDDLDAFLRLPAMFGRAAKRGIEIDVFALLTSNSGVGPVMGDGVAVFNSAHGNLAGSGTDITVASVDAARVAMGRQKDPSGNDYIGARPKILLCALEKGGTARVVNDGQFDVDVSNKFQVPNKVRGLFSNIIDTEQLTGNAWYMFADPMIIPAIEVAFLNGVQQPMLEQKDRWTTQGIDWRISMDYGVAFVDWRGIYRNPGA